MRSMNVPFVDLRAQYQSIKPDVSAAIESVLERTSFILGPDVQHFEASFAEYSGRRYCVGVESGTAALKLALAALGIGAGDEVIVPANTYIASAIAVSAAGATPVLVDMDDTYLMDAALIEAAVTPRTKAILPVHLYGQILPMEPILEIARRHDLRVIEDACQAHGARRDGRQAGSFGDAGCFSFYPGKNLGCYGDGGAVVTDDPQIDERVRLLRDFGQKRKYEHLIQGDNCRLDAIQAAVLNVKLAHLDEWNAMRRANAKTYDTLLQAAGFPTPPRLQDEAHVYHLYVTEVLDRSAVQAELAQRGIQSGIHYPIPIHLQPAYAGLERAKGSYPKTEAAADTILSLPMYPELSESQIEYVVSSLTSVARPAVKAYA
jgi:dTDP-4-amino-4,6-dideoxygalactose transaminase